jgi:hypothetical protein
MAAASVAVLIITSGCESTVDKANNLAQQGSSAFHRKGLAVASVDSTIDVVATRVIHDASGAAAVVEVRNRGRKPIRDAPIAIEVRDASGKTVFRNNAAGLQAGLSRIPFLPVGKTVFWVNDQVQATATPRRVVARVGRGTTGDPPPQLPIDGVHLAGDPVSGVEATGSVRNVTDTVQRNVVVSAVAKRGSAVVAAGRGLVPTIAPGKRQNFHVFFIGNPKGADLTVTALAGALSQTKP